MTRTSGVVVVFVALVTSLVGATCTDRRPAQDGRIVTAPAVERLSAALLWQDFRDMREQAERTYNGKAVIVTGTVTRTGSDDPDDRYVYFGQTETAGIHARLLDEQADAILAAAAETPRITLKCFCAGMTTDILLESCIAAP